MLFLTYWFVYFIAALYPLYWICRWRPARPSMKILRSVMRAFPPMVQPPLAECALVQDMRDCFPEVCRGRTLMLVMRDSPHYISRLTAEEQATYSGIFPAFVRALEIGGMPALDVGADYSEMDYLDREHLSEQGGRRMAREVAPKLREMANRLGFLNAEEGPRDDR